MGVSPTTVPANFFPRVGNPSWGVELPRGEIPIIELRSHMLSSGGNFINGAAKQGLWEGGISTVESGL